METKRRQRTTAEVSGTGPGVTNPGENHRRNVVAFNGRNQDMRECRLIGCREKSAEKRCGEECGGMPSNGKEEKITGAGCNHHEMMVAKEKRNPVNIIFYLSKVISPMFLDSVRTPRFSRMRKIHTRLQVKEKQQETRTPENSSLPILISFITLELPALSDSSTIRVEPVLFGRHAR